jgi:Contractile injection system tube protein
VAVLKGAFASFGAGLLGALPNIVVFQFNPERMTRTPRMVQPPPRTPPGQGNSNARQVSGEPSEALSFTLKIDASDALAQGNPIAAASGVLTTISALELLMVPQTSSIVNLAALAGGSAPAKAPPLTVPLVLFIWGPYRIVPVTITSLSITETEYDQLLNPIRAEVSAQLQILTPSDLADDEKIGRGAYKYSEGVKEVMAALNLANAAQLGISSILSFT